MEFRPVTSEEIDATHALYLEVFDWLKAKGVRQWLRAVPREEFQERQARGELFALFFADRMAAIASVAFEADTDWLKYISPDQRWWIKTLAVTRQHGGRALGELVIRKCEGHVARAGGTEAWLECVDTGFLPGYYARLGYEVVQHAEITYPSGNTFPVALMRKTLR